MTTENKDKSRDRSYRHKYDITLAQFDKLLADQEGKCKICKRSPKDGNWLCVDHNHNSQVVRDLLCRNCNLLLGHAKENPTVLDSARHYLAKWKLITDAELSKAVRFSREDLKDEDRYNKMLLNSALLCESLSSEIQVIRNRKNRKWVDGLQEKLLSTKSEAIAMANHDIDSFLEVQKETSNSKFETYQKLLMPISEVRDFEKKIKARDRNEKKRQRQERKRKRKNDRSNRKNGT